MLPAPPAAAVAEDHPEEEAAGAGAADGDPPGRKTGFFEMTKKGSA